MRQPSLTNVARGIAIAFSAPMLFVSPAQAQGVAQPPVPAASAPAPVVAAPEAPASAPAAATAASTEAAAGAAGAGAAPAEAGATAPAKVEERATEVQRIEVVARRTRENLQDVPTAVTAITSKDIADLQINGFEAVGQTVPNLYIQKQGGSPQAPQMQIRGVSNGSLNMQVDSGIGLYVDGVYMGRPGAAAFDLADLERVEVLRGPQGTLFGRNATGGAINLITAGPTGDFGFYGQIGAGNYNQRTYKGTLNTPTWNGLSARITLGHAQQDGDVKNTAAKRTFLFPEPFGSVTTNDRGGDNNSDAGLLALSYKGVKNLKVDYKYDFDNWRGTMNYRQNGNLDTTPCDPNNAPLNCLLPAMTAVAPFDQSFSYKSSLAVPMESTASNKVQGNSLVAEYALSDGLTAKYTGGYRSYKINVGGNQVYGASEYIDTNGVVGTPGSAFVPLLALRVEAQHQQSHEVQLIGHTPSFDWLAGAFYFDESGYVNNPVMLYRSYRSDGVVNPISVAGFDYFVGQNVSVSNQSTAAYLHGTWHVSNFDLSGGVRYTKDKRTEDVIAGGLIGAVNPGNQSFSYDGSNTDYDVSGTYKINKDSNVYAKYSTGYVSGGTLFGTRFDPEKMKAIELGYKSSLLQNKLRFNVAVFDQQRSNVQIEGFTSVGYFMGKGSDIRSDGVELEATYVPVAGLTLNGSFGYTDVSSSGQTRTFQPEETAYLGAQYEFAALKNGMMPSARIDASWHSKAYRLSCPAGQDQVPGTDTCVGVANPALDEAAAIPAVTMLGARLSLGNIKFGDGNNAVGTLSLWGRNLLNERVVSYPYTLGGSTIATTFTQSRTYGVEFSLDY
jgi:iron complex outermembrane receptor protein